MGPNIIPNLTNVSGRAAAVQTLRRQAALAIALRQHALERGAYPDTLEGFPGADEPSPLTGRLLGYERVRGGGAILLSPESAERVERDHIRMPGCDAYRWELPAVVVQDDVLLSVTSSSNTTIAPPDACRPSVARSAAGRDRERGVRGRVRATCRRSDQTISGTSASRPYRSPVRRDCSVFPTQ